MDSYLRPSRISNVTQTLTQNFENEGGKDEQSVYLSFTTYSNCSAITDNGPRSNVHLFKIMGHFEASSVAPTAGPTAWLG